MYSKCHSMYLKWTYFCNRHMGAISHWESCHQNIIIIIIKYMNSIVSSFIARIVSMSAITNYFCQIYENVDIMFIEIYRVH